jgi:hypothetical protein
VEHSKAFEEANGYCYALNRFEGERQDDVTSSSQLTDRYSQYMNCSHRITDAHMAQHVVFQWDYLGIVYIQYLLMTQGDYFLCI